MFLFGEVSARIAENACQKATHPLNETTRVTRNGLCEISGLNHCYENATAERLNGILKQEYGLDETFRNKVQAEQAVVQAVLLYNGSRPHLSLGYRTPNAVHLAA